VGSTNQVQAFHEPPSLRPHCSLAQQWITPELGLSSTPRQGILVRLRLQGKQHLESGRILPRMPSYAHYYQTLIPHMPIPPGSIHFTSTVHPCQPPSLGLDNRPDQEVSEPEVGAEHSLEETSYNNMHLPHLERDHTHAQLPPALGSNPRAIHLGITPHSQPGIQT
jgi:hypothetical protein